MSSLSAKDRVSLCMFAFADGHGEIHKWRDPRTDLASKYGDVHSVAFQLLTSEGNPENSDILWMQQRASARFR